MVELLLKHGAKGDESDVNSKKATDLATSLGHQDVLSLLAGEKLSKPLKKNYSVCYVKFFCFFYEQNLRMARLCHPGLPLLYFELSLDGYNCQLSTIWEAMYCMYALNFALSGSSMSSSAYFEAVSSHSFTFSLSLSLQRRSQLVNLLMPLNQVS